MTRMNGIKVFLAVSLVLVLPLFGACGKDSDNPADSGDPSLPKPSGLTATAVSSTEIELSWTIDAADTLTVRIERRESSGEFVEIAAIPADSTCYFAYDLTPNMQYAFRVRSSNAAGNSAYSNEATAKTASLSAALVPDVTFVSIPGGTFQMGDYQNAYPYNSNERPSHKVTISSFQMSEAEITNTQYIDWLNAALKRGEVEFWGQGVYGKKGAWAGQLYLKMYTAWSWSYNCVIRFGDNGFTLDPAPGRENWPVVYVTWYGAKAFATSNGWDLPREAEWEYACRGGKQYEYGTDDGTISPDKANYFPSVRSLTGAKNYPMNPYGLYNMSGNAWEWCGDWYAGYKSTSQKDPTGGSSGSERVFRGGGYDNYPDMCRSSARNHSTPEFCTESLGFRVVKRGSK